MLKIKEMNKYIFLSNFYVTVGKTGPELNVLGLKDHLQS